MNRRLFSLLFTFTLILFSENRLAAKTAEIRLVEKQMFTYPFSDPREMAEFGRFYPYHKFDGFTDKGEMQTWELVEMENDYIKVWVMPAVGGKVWGAVDKKSGREFIYFNHVVKFRDVAMRGPWTSGGIEMNFGLIGHSPWCADPVDYAIKTYDDGSVACIVGGPDLALENEWRVEIKLPADKALFETSVKWFNTAAWNRPAYQWMNAGIPTEGNLEYRFPGTKYLGHNGMAHLWPTDEKGRPINWYEANNFGGSKSYHVSGNYTDFWGTYWHDYDFGLGHSATYGDKLGMKIWIWGLAESGMIWEELLTDADGQYSEVQSGRYFNQSNGASFRTPFKHPKLSPHTTQSWTEYWYPVQGLGGLTYSTPELAFYLQEAEPGMDLHLYAVSPISGIIRVENNGRRKLNQMLDLAPTEVKSIHLVGFDLSEPYEIFLDDDLIYSTTVNEKPLSRPEILPEGYDHNSVHGLYLQGREFERQFLFERAASLYERALALDPFFSPALTGLSGIYYEQFRLEKADSLVRLALSIDTYDADANYLWGLICKETSRTADALDAFSLAAQNTEYQTAAYTEMAKIAVATGLFQQAGKWVNQALKANPENLSAWQVAVLYARLNGNLPDRPNPLTELLRIDPLNPFARYEMTLQENYPDSANWTPKNAFPHESYISIADFYLQCGQPEEAIGILLKAPNHAKVSYWLAWLYGITGDHAESVRSLSCAMEQSQSHVYPFRKNDYRVFEYAASRTDSWQPDYYLALQAMRRFDPDTAYRLLSKHDPDDFYPYYFVRAQVAANPCIRETDLKRAVKLSGERNYPVMALARHYQETEQWKAAEVMLHRVYELDPTNYTVGMALAAAYTAQGDYLASIGMLRKLNVLPYEGARDGRHLWRETHLQYAVELIGKNKLQPALKQVAAARLWPRNLGVGKPYPQMTDERLEDFMGLYIDRLRNKSAGPELQNLLAYSVHEDYRPYRAADLLTAIALRDQGEPEKGRQFLEKWMQDSPESQAARWCMAVYDRNTVLADEILNEPSAEQETLPYEDVFEDRDFPLLVRFSKLLLE